MIQHHVIPNHFYRQGLFRFFETKYLENEEHQLGSIRHIYMQMASSFKDLTKNTTQGFAIYKERVDDEMTMIGVMTQSREICERFGFHLGYGSNVVEEKIRSYESGKPR